MGTIRGLEYADNPVMIENRVLAKCAGGAPAGDGPVLGPEVVDRTGCPPDENCQDLWTAKFLPAPLYCHQPPKGHDEEGHAWDRYGSQTYIVPPNQQAVNIWMSGGGGGLGSQAHPAGTGGAAGFTWATFKVQPEWTNPATGQVELHVWVGCTGSSAGVGVQGVGGGGGGASAVLDLSGNVLVVAGGAGGQSGAWDASRQADGEIASTHGGHGGGPVGGDGGTTTCGAALLSFCSLFALFLLTFCSRVAQVDPGRRAAAVARSRRRGLAVAPTVDMIRVCRVVQRTAATVRQLATPHSATCCLLLAPCCCLLAAVSLLLAVFEEPT